MTWLLAGFAILIITVALLAASIWQAKYRPANRGIGFLIAGLLAALCVVAVIVFVLAITDLTG